MEYLILKANPHLLANTKKKNISELDFNDKLKLLLREEYNNIYLSDKIIYKIKFIIDEEIYSLRINQIIQKLDIGQERDEISSEKIKDLITFSDGSPGRYLKNLQY